MRRKSLPSTSDTSPATRLPLSLRPSLQPRKVQRADLAPSTGFAIVVDGHFKTEFVEDYRPFRPAQTLELLFQFPCSQSDVAIE
jgi:hypothetical protein